MDEHDFLVERFETNRPHAGGGLRLLGSFIEADDVQETWLHSAAPTPAGWTTWAGG